MKSHFRKFPEIPQETKDKIIQRWRFSKLNSIPTIAAEFDYPISQVGQVIDQYLSSKIKNINI
jgi:hypothetical protein